MFRRQTISIEEYGWQRNFSANDKSDLTSTDKISNDLNSSSRRLLSSKKVMLEARQMRSNRLFPNFLALKSSM